MMQPCYGDLCTVAHCMRHVLLLTPLSLSLLHRSLSTVDDMLSKRIDSNVDDGTRLACTDSQRRLRECQY